MANTITITGIEKHGPVLVCITDDLKDRNYKINLQLGTIYGMSGRPLQSVNRLVQNLTHQRLNSGEYFRPILEFFAQYGLIFCSAVESLLSYPELIPSYLELSFVRSLVKDYDGKLPKGYVTWCREKYKKFNSESLSAFKYEIAISQWPQTLRDNIEKINHGMGINLAHRTNYDKELCLSLVRMINNSLRQYQIRDICSAISAFIDKILARPYLRHYIDDTKSIKTAHQIINDVLDAERNKMVLKTEARIAALDGILVDDFVIKVPSAMEDFIDEGEQQHNCVGYHYHDKIARGNTFIYFLRRAENPNQSYVTCRYEWNMGTVEHRIRYNELYENGPLFSKIDRMITSLLYGRVDALPERRMK